MGCDIHFFAEKRADSNSPWEFLPAPGDGWDYKDKKAADEAGEEYICAHSYRYGSTSSGTKPGYEDPYPDEPTYLRDWFSDRNYRLFGMLANVRNGSGFAGCDMGDAVEPILPDPFTRGWPVDCCPELEAERDSIEHTPTWLTIKEMQDYFERKRSQPMTLRGCVPGAGYEELRDNGTLPTNYSGGISGPGIIVLHPAIYDLIDSDKIQHEKTDDQFDGGFETCVAIKDLPEGVMEKEKSDGNMGRIMSQLHGMSAKPDTLAKVYVRAEWQVPFSDSTPSFEACLCEMVEVAGVDSENIRAVFYFDS